MPKESILAYLAPLLTSQIENVATDALAHLLLQYPIIAAAFREFISSIRVEIPPDLIFKTQARFQDNAIPDLVGLDGEGRYILIIESKFWAPLTPNQPLTYINRLPHDTPAILLFIAPASRRLTLWQELSGRCNSSLIQSQDQQETNITPFFTLPLNTKHMLALTSWELLLENLCTKAKRAKDEYAASDIWQLQSLCRRIDEDAFQPLYESDITSPTIKRIHQLHDLIDDLVTRLVDSGIVSITGYKATPGPGYYKRYMSLQGIPNWCVEYNERYRKQHPPINIWLSTTETQRLTGLLSDLTPVSYRQGRNLLIPLEIPLNAERESILISLQQQVTAISKRLLNQ